MTVHAVANPHQTGLEPALVYDRATGYGIVTFDKQDRTMQIVSVFVGVGSWILGIGRPEAEYWKITN